MHLMSGSLHLSEKRTATLPTEQLFNSIQPINNDVKIGVALHNAELVENLSKRLELSFQSPTLCFPFNRPLIKPYPSLSVSGASILNHLITGA